MASLGNSRLSKEQAPGFTTKERDRIGMLWRRIQHLERRLANYKGNSPSFDMAECEALRWVLAEAGMPVPPRPEKDNDRNSIQSAEATAS